MQVCLTVEVHIARDSHNSRFLVVYIVALAMTFHISVYADC